MIIASIIFGVVGITLIILGYLIWKKEKISLLHDYHYNKVSEENKKIFCTLSGMGVLIIGVGLILSAVFAVMTDSPQSMIPFAVGFVVGIVVLIYVGIRYNR
jgi:uncharacterized membrane protein